MEGKKELGSQALQSGWRLGLHAHVSDAKDRQKWWRIKYTQRPTQATVMSVKITRAFI